jgi:hypothetical protein
VGRDADSEEVWARAHQGWLRLGAAERAARCAFWLAFGLLSRGERVRRVPPILTGRSMVDAELEAIVKGYARTAGFDQDQVNR